jgi:S1-C subfamily serine protease
MPLEIPRKYRRALDGVLDDATMTQIRAAYRELRAGDAVTIVYLPSRGVSVRVNGAVIAASPDHRVVESVLAAWANKKPVDQHLRTVLAKHPAPRSPDEPHATPSISSRRSGLVAPGASAQTRACRLHRPDEETRAGGGQCHRDARRRRSASAGSNRQKGGQEDPMLEFFRRFLPDPNDREARQGLASGFIISEDGYILTNAHVVDGFDDVSVRLADAKREFKAKVIGFDKRTDVALLKVEAKGLPVAKLGSSKDLQPGEWVAAIGSPFGFANTITAGIVSAKERSLPDEVYVPFIQTDVAVNPAINKNAFNQKGEVGRELDDLQRHRRLEAFRCHPDRGGDGGEQATLYKVRAWCAAAGIAIQPLTKELAKSFKLDTTDWRGGGRGHPGGPWLRPA